MDQDRVAALKAQIADLKRRWPAHSVLPALMAQLDALEDELAEELKTTQGEATDSQA
ncbi:MAG: histidine kinase [Chloroflexi bacterium]|nr:histidine kinase [Chloroflexota bacterium]